MAIVVSDTSPIRAFAHLGRYDLLASLFGEVLVPPAVVTELESPTSKLPPLITRGVRPFRVVIPKNVAEVDHFAQTLDAGESEAIALANELGVSLLIDERNGRSIAARWGITAVGTLGTLLLAKHHALIPAIRPLMEQLRDETRFHLSTEVFNDMLLRAGESA